MFTCGSTSCGQSKRLGVPQPGWVLQLPIHGNMSLDMALEKLFFGREFEAHCSSCGPVSGEECARLCRLPTTLIMNFKRGNKVNPLTRLPVCLSVCTSVRPSVRLSVCLSDWCQFDVSVALSNTTDCHILHLKELCPEEVYLDKVG